MYLSCYFISNKVHLFGTRGSHGLMLVFPVTGCNCQVPFLWKVAFHGTGLLVEKMKSYKVGWQKCLLLVCRENNAEFISTKFITSDRKLFSFF